MWKDLNESLGGQDEAVVRAALVWLAGERGAVSATVQLPSGLEVLVHVTGRVQVKS